MPFGAPIIEDGYLYGTTGGSGLYNNGTAYKLKIADNTFSKIHDFKDADGSFPQGSLFFDGTYLYGMASQGGEFGWGTVYKINLSDGSCTVLHSFKGTDGGSPMGALISDGTYLYGMSFGNGSTGHGNIFKISISDGSFVILHVFTGQDGQAPNGSLVSDGAFLYGMSTYGGSNSKGNFFKLKIADNTFTDLYDFNGTDGYFPTGTLIIDGASLYGMTTIGGLGNGVVFKYQYTDVIAGEDHIIYVDSAAQPGGDGSSWATAVTKLSDALHYARTYSANWAATALNIYVAKGTYFPQYRADNNEKAVDDRNDAFVMVKNVKIFGGYPTGGGDGNLGANPTVLSGDIGTENDASDNAYHVVVSAGDIGSGSINGFTITGGNANGTDIITVHGQTAHETAGGGIYTIASDLLITNSIISGNEAEFGGGIYNVSSNPRLTNILISNNTAHDTGGGIRVFNCDLPLLKNVTISGNEAAFGGGIASADSHFRATNSIIYGNEGYNGNNVHYSGLPTEFQYCLMEGTAPWDSDWGTDLLHNVITTDNPFTDNVHGNYQLAASSHAIDAGSNTFYSDVEVAQSGDKDLAGNERIYNKPGGGIIDLGAYEFQGAGTVPVKTSPLSGLLNKNNEVILTWSTYTESNNKGFQIEYGVDGIHFENGLFVPSKAMNGISSMPIDYRVNAGILTGPKYYRLKQLNLGGKSPYSYSNIIRLEGHNTGISLKVYPNPTHDYINLHVDGGVSPNGQVVIVDFSGHIVQRQVVTNADSDVKIDLSGLANGVYILKYMDDAHASMVKIIKN